jgi:hypothetical protein
MREGGTAAARDSEALHCSVALAAGAAGAELQVPAVAAVVDAADQQAQDAQPSVCSAEEAQQQPPAHKLVPQSALAAQASPGELSWQEPKGGVQVAQPSSFAVALQQ